MSERTDADRIKRLEATNLAYGLILKAVVGLTLQNPDLRAKVRERVCAAIEGLYQEKLKTDAHLSLQIALDEVEAIFGGGPPRDEQIPQG